MQAQHPSTLLCVSDHLSQHCEATGESMMAQQQASASASSSTSLPSLVSVPDLAVEGINDNAFNHTQGALTRRVSNYSSDSSNSIDIYEDTWSNFPISSAVDRKSHGARKVVQCRERIGTTAPAGTATGETRWHDDDFQVLRHLGQGNYGVIVKASYKRGRGRLAIKQIAKDRILRDEYRGRRGFQLLSREIEIHSRLRHNNIVRFFGYFHCRENVRLVLDYARFGNLHTYIHQHERGVLELGRARSYLRQVASALSYLDEMQISHRDIKQENILMTSKDTLQLCDFGSAVRWRNTATRTTLCGTPLYVPPELLQDAPQYNTRYVDWWAFGILAHELILTESPFECDGAAALQSNNRHEIFAKIRNHHDLTLPACCETNAQSFIQRLLQRTPEDRMSPKEAQAHPFLAEQPQPTATASTMMQAEPFIYSTPCKATSVATANRPYASWQKRSQSRRRFLGEGDKTWYAPIKRRRLRV